MMWIYKITNIQNNKVYIGQTIRSVQDRFNRHISDAINNIIDTHFARAIRKYGKDSFKYEIIDTASTVDELTSKEYYWIKYYNSTSEGYNETDALYKCGGNTYMMKSKEEMEIIKNKIRKTKLGGLNPHSTTIIMIDIETQTKTIFQSQRECATFLNLKDHMAISRRCLGKIKKPLFGRYKFEYYKEEPVSTNPDECKDVGEEISTSPKRKTA